MGVHWRFLGLDIFRGVFFISIFEWSGVQFGAGPAKGAGPSKYAYMQNYDFCSACSATHAGCGAS